MTTPEEFQAGFREYNAKHPLPPREELERNARALEERFAKLPPEEQAEILEADRQARLADINK